MDDEQFQKLLRRFELSWKGYRKVRKGVKKRIRRHMQKLRCQSMEDYFLALDRGQEVKLECERLLTVSISRLFRDCGLWKALENQILPGLVEKNKETVKVWFAGCACGEEVYSFRILWDRARNRLERLPNLEALATDINPVYLYRAQLGLFSRSSLKQVPEDVRRRYFKLQKDAQYYNLRPFVKKDISWRVQSLLQDPPGRGFHLIFLRNNLLTYYEDKLKKPASQKVIDCLVPGGFLIIGSHERLPLEMDHLIPYSEYPYIFQSQEFVNVSNCQTEGCQREAPQSPKGGTLQICP